MCTPARSWWTIFAVEPIPTPPGITCISFPMACNRGSTYSNDCGSPDAIMVISPARARTAPPLIGQSQNLMFLSANRSEADLLQAADTVEETTTQDPSRSTDSRLAPSPPPPKQVASHCASFTSTMRTTSVDPSTNLSRVSSEGRVFDAAFPAASASSWNAEITLGERSNPDTSSTAGDRRRDRAIPPPMAPRPTTATFMTNVRCYSTIISDNTIQRVRR
mmetsp:Transcript_5495/g.11965  ORF Transcript_5495/g.11965 Transcript_5495/m.11965 type:complete len:220 (+) Transcript_5495:790-1449(+)